MKKNKNNKWHSKTILGSKHKRTITKGRLSGRTTTTNQKPSPGHKK